MLSSLISLILGNMSFMGSYSNEMFPPPLDSKKEEEYIRLMLNGDKDARNELIMHNLRLVAHIVKKFETLKCDTDDLIGIGTVGLIKGIDTYSPNKKVKLTTYIAKCCENEILMYFRSNKKYNNNISIYDNVSYDKEGNEITIMDIIKTKDPDYLEDIYIRDNINLLYKYLNVLNKREKDIIIKRYGLNNENEMTQKEISKKIGISRSYVSRIEKRAMTKILREFIRNNNIN